MSPAEPFDGIFPSYVIGFKVDGFFVQLFWYTGDEDIGKTLRR